MSIKIKIYNLLCIMIVFTKATSANHYLGCFIDAAERDLPHRLLIDPQMTISRCIGHCVGYKFAGLQVCMK